MIRVIPALAAVVLAVSLLSGCAALSKGTGPACCPDRTCEPGCCPAPPCDKEPACCPAAPAELLPQE